MCMFVGSGVLDWCAATRLTPCRLTLLLPNINAPLLSLFDLGSVVKSCCWVKKWTMATRSGSCCFHLKGMLSVPVLLLLAPCSAACLYYSVQTGTFSPPVSSLISLFLIKTPVVQSSGPEWSLIEDAPVFAKTEPLWWALVVCVILGSWLLRSFFGGGDIKTFHINIFNILETFSESNQCVVLLPSVWQWGKGDP